MPNDEFPDPDPLDTNDDGFTDGVDIGTVAVVFGEAQTPSNVRFDSSLDGFIDGVDIGIMAVVFGQACTP